MENGNGKKIEHRLTVLEESQKSQTLKLDRIESQVSNHIPSILKNLEKNQKGFIEKQNSRILKMYIAVILLLIGVIVNLLIQFA